MTTSDRSAAADTRLTAPTPPGGAARRTWRTVAVVAVVLVILAAIAYNASRGADAARIANPAAHGAPRPVRYRFGSTHWRGRMPIWAGLAMLQRTRPGTVF